MQIQRTNTQPAFGSIGRGLNSHIAVREQLGALTPDMILTCNRLKNDTLLHFDFDRNAEILFVQNLESGEEGQRRTSRVLVLNIAEKILDTMQIGKQKLQEVLAKLDLESNQG